MLTEKLLFPSEVAGRSRQNSTMNRARSISQQQGIIRTSSVDTYNPMLALRLDLSNHSHNEASDPRSLERSVTQKLARLNPFLAKKLAEQAPLLLLEISADGKHHQLKKMTMRELLVSVQDAAISIDEDFVRSQSGSTANVSSSIGDDLAVGVNDPTTPTGADKHRKLHQDVLIEGPATTPRIRNSNSSNSYKPSATAGLLQQRDLRRLEFYLDDPALSLSAPTVLVRRHAVVLSLDPLRCIVMADRLLLIVPEGGQSLLQILQEHLRSYDQNTGNERAAGGGGAGTMADFAGTMADIPFEARVYETIYATAVAVIADEYDTCKTQVLSCLAHFEETSIVEIEVQQCMRSLKNKVSSMIVRMHSIRRSFIELLEDADTLSLMNLTMLKSNPSLYNKPLVAEITDSHEEIEILLETFLMDYTSLEEKLEALRTQMNDAEELGALRLDTSRNQLLIVDTVISVIAATVALGSFVGSMFGMNLTSGIEMTGNWFWGIFWFCNVLVFVVAVVVLLYLQSRGILPGKRKIGVDISKEHFALGRIADMV